MYFSGFLVFNLTNVHISQLNHIIFNLHQVQYCWLRYFIKWCILLLSFVSNVTQIFFIFFEIVKSCNETHFLYLFCLRPRTRSPSSATPSKNSFETAKNFEEFFRRRSCWKTPSVADVRRRSSTECRSPTSASTTPWCRRLKRERSFRIPSSLIWRKIWSGKIKVFVLITKF